MNADVVLIFFNRKLKTVLFILVVIAINGYLYAFIDRNLTQYHNSWTADAVAICCHCHYKLLFYESCVFVLYNLILRNRFGNLVSQSLLAVNIYFRPITAISTFLCVGICTLALRSAAPPSGGPLASTSIGGCVLGLCCCYMIMCYSSVSVYTIWGQYHLTIQVKLGYPTDWLNSLNLSPSA